MKVKNYCVIENYKDGKWALCEKRNKNAKMLEIAKHIYGDNPEPHQMPDCNTLEYCIGANSGWLDRGRDFIIEGDRFGSITIDEYDCFKELQNCFDNYVSDDEIEELLKEDMCFRDFLWNKIDNVIFRHLMVQELEEMLEMAKIKDYTMEHFR